MMKQTILLAITICLFATTIAQKTKVLPAQRIVKSFVVTEETKMDLPEGVLFINNKITLKTGYRFEQTPDGKGFILKSSNTTSGTFKCVCQINGEGGGRECTPALIAGALSCHGNCTCVLLVDVATTKIIKMQ